jgi:hypothetical protein
MAQKKPVNLKHSEIEHILRLIQYRQEQGWYTGTKSAYEERERAIQAKLEQAAKTKAIDPVLNRLDDDGETH